MKYLIRQLRKALIHYEECVDVDGAEYIVSSSLAILSKCLSNLQHEVNKQMLKIMSEID